MWHPILGTSEETKMSKEKKALPLGSSTLAVEIKHLDNLGGKSQHYKLTIRGNWRKPGEYSDNDPLSYSWKAKRIWEVLWNVDIRSPGQRLPWGGGQGGWDASPWDWWAQQGEDWCRYRSACYAETWGLGKVGAPDNREEGKAEECNSDTIRISFVTG